MLFFLGFEKSLKNAGQCNRKEHLNNEAIGIGNWKLKGAEVREKLT